MPRSPNSVTHNKYIKYANRVAISTVWMSAIQEANFGLVPLWWLISLEDWSNILSRPKQAEGMTAHHLSQTI